MCLLQFSMFGFDRRIKSRRRGSVPDMIDFEDYKKRKGYHRDTWENDREFARNIWNQWFDQVSFFQKYLFIVILQSVLSSSDFLF